MKKAKDEAKVPTPFEVLGTSIGLPAATAELRLGQLPQELQSPILDEIRKGDRAKIVKAFTRACCLHDKQKADAQKATDATHDHLEEPLT